MPWFSVKIIEQISVFGLLGLLVPQLTLLETFATGIWIADGKETFMTHRYHSVNRRH